MIFDEIVLHNFGVYKDRQILKLTPPSKTKPIILFGGLNGGGKTTLLDALQLALYGKFAQCSNRGALGYDEFLRRCIHRNINPKDGAAVELEFRHRSGGEENTYRINRVWKENGKGIKETVEVLRNGELDQVLTDAWYEHVDEFLPASISNLFFFDGEKIEAFADIDNSAAILSKAIHSLLGVDIVDRLTGDLDVIQRRKKTEQKNEVDQKLILQFETELDHLTQRRGALDQERAKIQIDIDVFRKQLQKLENEYRREGGDLYENRIAIEKERAHMAEKIHALETELRQIAAESAPLLLVLDDLGAIQEQDIREEESKKSTLLNSMLEERDEALLEKMSEQGLPQEAFESIKNFLYQDRQSRAELPSVSCYLDLNAETRQNTHNLLNFILPEIKNKTYTLLKTYDQLQKQLDDLDRKLSDVPDHHKLAPIIKEHEKKREAIQQFRIRLAMLEKEKKTVENIFETKEMQLVKLIDKKVAIQMEQEDAKRVIAYANKVQNTLRTFRSVLVERHVSRIENLILDCFQQLLRKKSLVKNLRIDPKTFSLQLRDAQNQILFPDRLSAGERQLLAISMLWGLARASGRPLPIIVDTPLGRLDTEHRTHLVDRYFPNASHQVLVLSTNEEIDEVYYKKLKPRIGHAYHLVFDDDLGGTQVQRGYFWQD